MLRKRLSSFQAIPDAQGFPLAALSTTRDGVNGRDGTNGSGKGITQRHTGGDWQWRRVGEWHGGNRGGVAMKEEWKRSDGRSRRMAQDEASGNGGGDWQRRRRLATEEWQQGGRSGRMARDETSGNGGGEWGRRRVGDWHGMRRVATEEVSGEGGEWATGTG
jgi:hypothetical protein